MTKVKCNVIGLFIMSISDALFGITTLVLAIIFNMIGFTPSSLSMSSCSQTYLMTKFSNIQLQLQTSFICICTSVLMCVIILILSILSLKSLKSVQNQNPQNEQTLSTQILSKNKYLFLYIFLSVESLGIVIGFGYYLMYFIQIMTNSNTCLFSYDYTNFIVLTSVSGVWLICNLITYVFMLRLKGNFIQEEDQESVRNKYLQMQNLTQQPQAIQQNQVLNGLSRQNLEPTRENLNNQKTRQRSYQPRQFSKNRPQSNPRRQLPERILTYQNFTKDQLKDSRIVGQPRQSRYTRANKQQKQAYGRRQDNSQVFNKRQNPITRKNQSPYQDKIIEQPRFALQSANSISPNINIGTKSNRFDKQQNQTPIYQKSPNNTAKNTTYSRYAMESPTKDEKTKNRAPGVIRSPVRDMEEGEDSRGQLVFYKKALENQNNQRADQRQNSRPIYQKPYPKPNQTRYQMSYQKSNQMTNLKPFYQKPYEGRSSRVQDKFLKQQQNYLKNNVRQSILPNSGIRERSNQDKVDSRFKNYAEQSRNQQPSRIYQPGRINQQSRIYQPSRINSPSRIDQQSRINEQSRNLEPSKFGQASRFGDASRNGSSVQNGFNLQSPQNSRSKAKTRDGVLTSFIRGKFN